MAPGLDWWLCYGIHLKLLSSVLAPTSGTVRAMGMDPMRDRVRYVSRIDVVFGWRTDCGGTSRSRPASSGSAWCGTSRAIATGGCSVWRARLLGLDELFDSLARQLSLGQKMRADLG
jgi:ABC-2 type transport system ATP-binding protein